VQVGCTFTAPQLVSRKIEGLWIGCIGVVGIALFLTVYTSYIEQIALNNFVEWDVRTLTAADYTVEFNMKERFYQKFIEEFG